MEYTDVRSGGLESTRARVIARLRPRYGEIEQAIYARVRDGVLGVTSSSDARCHVGLRPAIAVTVAFILECMEHGWDPVNPMPSEVLAPAREAARCGVNLGTVLLCYIAGSRILGGFVMSEVERAEPASRAAIQLKLRRMQEALLEHLTSAMIVVHNEERERILRSPDERRGDTVRRLLDGEPVDQVELVQLDYDIHLSWHIGVIALGGSAEERLRDLASDLGVRRLVIVHGDTTWAWFGARRRTSASELERAFLAHDSADVSLVLGDARRGMKGWRQTHQEAQGALLRALYRPERLVRYADRPLLTAALRDDTLASWLTEFLAPLRARADGGLGLLQALRAYIDAECNYRAAASALNLDRHTIESRVRTAERSLGHSVRSCLSELDVALRFQELASSGAGSR